MAVVIPFRRASMSAPAISEEPEIDLYTAVDWAIRDLREIGRRCDEAARLQAEECRLMLERALITSTVD